jgi:hypothetical protein
VLAAEAPTTIRSMIIDNIDISIDDTQMAANDPINAAIIFLNMSTKLRC